jgi:hypothetical protein
MFSFWKPSKKKILSSSNMYGVEIFWSLIQDGSGLPKEHFDMVFSALKELLKAENFE